MNITDFSFFYFIYHNNWLAKVLQESVQKINTCVKCVKGPSNQNNGKVFPCKYY